MASMVGTERKKEDSSRIASDRVIERKGVSALDDREAITWFNPMEDREEDRAPLSVKLIRRIWTYSRPYAARRAWLFFLTVFRGLQLPALAWMIGQTITGPIAGKDVTGIYLHTGIYLALVFLMVVTLHFRQRPPHGLFRGDAFQRRRTTARLVPVRMTAMSPSRSVRQTVAPLARRRASTDSLGWP